MVNAVNDSSGNPYAPAIRPMVSGIGSQSIYYARNIAPEIAGANTVTVTFASAVASLDIRILEYAGADAVDPVDVTAAKCGQQHYEQQRFRDRHECE